MLRDEVLPQMRTPIARSLAAVTKKPAADRTMKEAWFSDPATYPILFIIVGKSNEF